MGFSERFPRWITGVLGLVQLLLTTAIIGLEIGSVYIDVAHGTIWVGLWSGLVFMMTVLAMMCISKYLLLLFFFNKSRYFYFFQAACCRGRCYGFYVLILNSISIFHHPLFYTNHFYLV